MDDALIDEAGRLRALKRYGLVDSGRDASFDRITRVAGTALETPIAAVSMIDADRQWFKSILGLETRQTDRNLAFCRYTILSRAPLVVPDATEDARFARNPLVTQEPGIRAYMGVPLSTPDGYNLGALCVIDRVPRRDFTSGRAALLRDLGDVLTQEMDLRMLSQTDCLTGIATRRHFMEAVAREIDRASRYARPISLALIDVDHFKDVNDTHGHPVGDEILRALVERLQEGLREHDLLGRLGGEEFGIVLPETPLKAAATMARRLCARIAERPLLSTVGPIPLTISIGVSACRDPDGQAERLVADADRALYRAKLDGRDRVCLASAA